MKSIYGVRIFELLSEKIKTKTIPRGGVNVEMSMQYLRECCDCEDKYERFSQFKARVLDRAIEEIERVTTYRVKYDYIKKGKAVTGIRFHVTMCYY